MPSLELYGQNHGQYSYHFNVGLTVGLTTASMLQTEPSNSNTFRLALDSATGLCLYLKCPNSALTLTLTLMVLVPEVLRTRPQAPHYCHTSSTHSLIHCICRRTSRLLQQSDCLRSQFAAPVRAFSRLQQQHQATGPLPGEGLQMDRQQQRAWRQA